MTRTRNALLNYATALGLNGATLVAGFLATPRILGYLGEDRYGAFRALGEWLGWLSLLDVGLGNALLPLLASALGKGDRDEALRTLAAGIRAHAKVALAMLACGVGLSLVVEHLVPVPGPLVPELHTACVLWALSFLVVPLLPFRALAEAQNRAYVVNVALAVQSLAMIGLLLAFARAGAGLPGQAAATVLALLVLPFALVLHARRELPGALGLAVGREDLGAARSALFGLNRPMFFMNLYGRVSLLSDGIVLALVAGSGAVVPLVLTERLAFVVLAQLQGAGSATWASLAELHARGEHEVFRRRVVELSGLVTALGVAALAPIVAWNESFVRLWVGSARFGGDAVTIAAVLVTALQALSSLWCWCFVATGEVSRLVPLLGASMVLNLAASVALTWRFGVPGPLLGTLVAFAATNLWALPLLLARTHGVSIRALAGAVARPLAVGVPAALALRALAQAHPATRWPDLLLALGASGLAVAFAVFALALEGEARRDLVARLRAALPGGVA